jgi:biotin-dependent carboxylase-like uncharacterized protein
VSEEVLKVVRAGLGASIQDCGRPGFARFGVPPGGVMDDHAAGWANQLLENSPGAPVLELLLQGAQLEVLRPSWLVITGGDAGCNRPLWRIVPAQAGEQIVFPASRKGLWTYVAVEGGFDAPRYFGSASVYPRGRIGNALANGNVLSRVGESRLALPRGVAGRALAMDERHDYSQPPTLRIWPGPQWDYFGQADRAVFFQQAWTVSPQSDRVGYRLEGTRLTPAKQQIPSEPVLVGSIQVPPLGQPIVTMRDGPTVGGYPKIGLVEPEDLSWLAQCRPGTQVRFKLVV